MKKVIMTVGLPGSGKSSWAKELQSKSPNTYKRINKDDLRSMLDNGKWSRDAEKFILKIRDALILQVLEAGKHVIIDDTNLHPKHIESVSNLVKGIAEIAIEDFTHISVEECIKNDLRRENSVGSKVIRDMYKQFILKTEVYSEDKSLPKAIIVDLDGTLAIHGDRSPYDWHRVKEDIVDETVRRIINNYHSQIIVVSGRDGVCAEDSRKWLDDNGVHVDASFFRPQGNFEKDSIIKRRIFEENIRGKYYIEFVLDDRNQVVEMWRSLGLKVLQVADGDF